MTEGPEQQQMEVKVSHGICGKDFYEMPIKNVHKSYVSTKTVFETLNKSVLLHQLNLDVSVDVARHRQSKHELSLLT